MKLISLLILIALPWGGVGAAAQAQDFVRQSNEPDLAFAGRVLHAGEDGDPHVVTATWNGVETLFVDYLAPTKAETDRPMVALQRQPDGRYRLIRITVGEEEGGTASFEAIGFAKADHSGAKALIAILTWPVQHYDVGGTLYDVRIFAAPHPGQTQLNVLKITKHFDGGCECSHGDGPPKHPQYETHFRYRTIAAVKRELARLGY